MLWAVGLCGRISGPVIVCAALLSGLVACAGEPHEPPEPSAALTVQLTQDERIALRLACASVGSRSLTEACYAVQAGELAGTPRPVRLASLSGDERLQLNAACSSAQTLGPAELRRCQGRVLAGMMARFYAEPEQLSQPAVAPTDPPPRPEPEVYQSVSPETKLVSRPEVIPQPRPYLPREPPTSPATDPAAGITAGSADAAALENAPIACPEHFLSGEAPELANPKLGTQARGICYASFAVLHSGVTRTPIWAAEHLTRTAVQAAKAIARRGSFHPDRSLSRAERAELKDYERSGYDRGHLAPADDMPDQSAQGESFSLANIVPQEPHLNRGLWAAIENAVRELARKSGAVYVVTGSIYAGNRLKALNGRVLVPTQLFKAVYDPARRGAGAYVAANDNVRTWEVVSLSRLEQLAGIDAFPSLPPAVRATALLLPSPYPKDVEETGREPPLSPQRMKRPDPEPHQAKPKGPVVPTLIPALPRSQPRPCCRHCSKGQPCGNSCISWRYTCRQPPGCAC